MRMSEEMAGRLYDLLAEDEPEIIDALARIPCSDRRETAVGYIADWLDTLPDRTISAANEAIDTYDTFHSDGKERSSAARAELVRYGTCRKAGSLLVGHLRYNDIEPSALGLDPELTWDDASQMLWDRDATRARPIIERMRQNGETMDGIVADRLQDALDAGTPRAPREAETEVMER